MLYLPAADKLEAQVRGTSADWKVGDPADWNVCATSYGFAALTISAASSALVQSLPSKTLWRRPLASMTAVRILWVILPVESCQNARPNRSPKAETSARSPVANVECAES